MARSLQDIPKWADLNPALLYAPILLTAVAALGSFRFWFVPRSEFIVPAALALTTYYVIVVHICCRSSGRHFSSLWPTFRRSHPKTSDAVLFWGGLGVFGTAAFYAFYAVIPAAFTAIMGNIVEKRASVAFVDSINPSAGFGTATELRGISPAMSAGCCIGNRGQPHPFMVGDRVSIHGRRSVLGPWVIRIEHM